MAEAAALASTRDSLFAGRLILHQPASGHRVGTDAVLLQAAVSPGLSGKIYDVGAGVGAVGLAIALESPGAAVTLIENDPTYLELAVANVAANGLAGQVRVADCDLLSKDARGGFAAAADVVVTNPPFHRADQVRVSPVDKRRAAHVLGSGGLMAWLEACLSLLGPKGTLCLIHQASALAGILGHLEDRLGGLTLIAVHPRIGQPASRVLVRGTKGSRAPLRIAPPLVLHEGNDFTRQAADLHTGTSRLVW